MQIEILDPKARRVLEELADQHLISIREPLADSFSNLVNKFRDKAKDNPPSLDEITEEVEAVRAKRYESSKKQGNH